ncbi:phage tail sheath family protein [Bradyrhizobium sp. AZCC 2289]|uniref:phage tail sheath family protein n=1 Tax=Bradyrhizobium sp. AZCC 2289 TaxID=3117026 RepID=UPI002FEE924C
MPIPVKYPGVSVQEIPNVTITGVETSITAFVGRAMMGPLAPMHCFSAADFERSFGGRTTGYPLGNAVEDFFGNGGSHAIIVRVFKAPAGAGDGLARADGGGLTLVAAAPGAWPNGHLLMSIDATLGSVDSFNLTLTYKAPDGSETVERFQNVSIKGDAGPHRLDRVLETQSQLARVPGDPLPVATPTAATHVAFAGGADSVDLTAADLAGNPELRTGIYALDNFDLFNLMCIPPDPADADYGDLETLYQAAALYCLKRRAMLILDPPKAWSDHARQGRLDQIQPSDLGIGGPELEARNCAVYFPRIRKADPKTGQIETFPPCGAIAGIFAATDNLRGVWKAPAGITAGIGGINGLEFSLNDEQNGQLNPLGINCLRNFPVVGPVVWGARTLRGADLLSDDYKYVPVRRLALYIEESLVRGTKFAVFEPNGEALWSTLRQTIGAFMTGLFQQGAFYGYDVACDGTTTTQDDIDRGVVNVRVAFAPVKPAEFIVLQIQQQAGQTAP